MSSKVAHEERQRVRNTFRAEERLNADELDKLESERIAKKVEKVNEECKYYETLLSVKEFEARKGE